MKLTKLGIVATVLLASLGFDRAQAQTTEIAGPGPLEVSLVPGGGTFFASKGATPSFGNYNLGGSVVYNITPWIGVEGEVGGTLGISQTLQFGAISGSIKTPNMATYAGNVIVSAPTHSALFPYIAGGVGGLTLVKTTSLGINSNDTFLTGNIGGGVRWYANRRWGLRGEYRLIAVKSKDDAPAFFGQDTRYGHRVYGGVVVNVLP